MQKLDELLQAKLQEKESKRRCSTECQGSPGRRRGNSAFAVVLFIAFLAAMLLAWMYWAAQGAAVGGGSSQRLAF